MERSAAIKESELNMEKAAVPPLDAPLDLVPAKKLGRLSNVDRVKTQHDPQMVDLFVEHMLLGDELAYAAWLALLPLKGEGKRMIATALEKGVESVCDAPPELVRLFAEADRVPSWVDWDQLYRGGIAIWRAGNLVPICLAYSSVGFGFSSYGGTKALNFTRLLVDNDRAGARLSETLRWFVAVTTPDGMRRENAGFKYSMRVRMVHAAARYGVSRSPLWKWNDWGLPITNTDLFFTTSKVFCANLVEALGRLGISYNQQEKADIFALWRYIAYVMGVPDELNHRDMADSLEKNEVIVAIERAPDEACRVLLHALIGYTTEADGGYQALPAWLLNTLSTKQKLTLTYNLIRYLTDDKFCDDMDIPRRRGLWLIGIASALLRAKGRVTRLLPGNDERKVAMLLDHIRDALAIEDEQAIASPEEVRHAIQAKQPRLLRQAN